jgi:hypothetical protein
MSPLIIWLYTRVYCMFDGASRFCQYYSKLGYISERNITNPSVYLLYDYTNYHLSTITVVDGAAMSAEPWTRPPGE